MAVDGLYIQMFSIHGLVRHENPEMGRDADTGGQIKYVLELCRYLAGHRSVRQVDLFTRFIDDKILSDDYTVPIQEVEEGFRIVRIQCGGKKYMRKELLWPHLDEYIDKTIRFIKRENAIPDVVHGHYADAGYVAMQLSSSFGIPFVFTGHSLGRAKRQKLLDDGLESDEIERKYRIDHRIRVEENILRNADLVITSTHQEAEEQYGMYRFHEAPRYQVIPPGLDVDIFYPFYRDMVEEQERSDVALHTRASIFQELNRFFVTPDKPLILALCRPDKRKNISGLIHAYGEDKELQTMANLAIYAGLRKDISEMEDNEREVLTEMLLLMDKYDLYGKMAIPKKHDFEHEVPELYRIAAQRKGVFVNPALTEPFGLTLLEAAAVGLPVVATNDGGPRDIFANCGCGQLIDPTDGKKIAAAIRKVLADGERWERFSKNGILNVRKHYTWISHTKTYMEEINDLLEEAKTSVKLSDIPMDPIGRRLAGLNHFIITDIDNTLIGEDNSRLAEFLEIVRENRSRIGFGVATGRSLESAVHFLKQHKVEGLDVIISSVGSEIYYGAGNQPGIGWRTHISNKWDRKRIKGLLDGLPFLEYQEEANQRPFKISYNMAADRDHLASVHDLLLKNKCPYSLIYSHQKYLDILPYRASKGKAIRYLSYKWEIPLGNFLVCGDSGNDEEMLRGEPKAVVVGNYSPELEKLRGRRKIFFATKVNAGGILEALEHYNFLKEVNP
ncbi:MAG: HAD-IIB family hydrolase [bacterium]|nr:MAG: HAD-IIB family hydrolase [bacterium]